MLLPEKNECKCFFIFPQDYFQIEVLVLDPASLFFSWLFAACSSFEPGIPARESDPFGCFSRDSEPERCFEKNSRNLELTPGRGWEYEEVLLSSLRVNLKNEFAVRISGGQ
jgi:hypothetical protein